MSDEQRKELSISTGNFKVIVEYSFYKSSWLDKDQVRVSEVVPGKYYRVKCGRMLTDQEVRGAIVKYLISKRRLK